MDDLPLKSLLGRKVRNLREARGLSQEQVAQQLEVTPRYYAGIERGERNMTLDSIDTLASRLGVPATTLLEAEEVNPR